MDVDRAGPIAIIAGNGSFPLELAESLSARGKSVFILGLRGFASRAIKSHQHVIVDMLDPQRILKSLREANASAVVLAGGVDRPGPLAALSIYSFLRHRAELKRIFAGGDDHLLRAVIGLFEEAGFPVLGVDEVAPEVLATEGQLGSVSCPASCMPDVAIGMEFLYTVGRFDIGQGVVVADGRIIAVEGPEGTDAMLMRIGELRKNRRIRLERDQPILVKASKPSQDRRADLPAIGPNTIRSGRKVGLAGIAVASGDVVLVEKANLLRAADEAGLFLVGVRKR